MARKQKKRKHVPKAQSAKTKRHHREKAKRLRQAKALGVGAKDRFVSGCIASGFIGAFLLIAALTWTCFVQSE